MYCLSCRLTITGNNENTVLKKDNVINKAKIKINSFEWYVPHYTVNISQQAILSKQILSRTTTELQHVQRSGFMKEADTQNSWIFELGTQEGTIIPIWPTISFQRRDRQD